MKTNINTNTTQRALPIMRQNNTKEALATWSNIYFANTNTNADIYTNTQKNICFFQVC